MTYPPLRRMHRLHRIAGRTALTVTFFSGIAAAQFRASIQGTVADAQGGVIPGATLTLTDTDTSRVFTATSNSGGVYTFNALALDHYKLAIEAKGFQKQEIDAIQINPDQANAVDVQLQIGDVATVVNVSGNELPAIDTATASINGNISGEQIQHLPSSGRDVFQLVQLAPGVFGDGGRSSGGGTRNLPGTVGPGGGGAGQGIFQTENGAQSNANGGQNTTNGISIDGISTVSSVWGGASVITPSEDSVGNVKVVANSYDAENGRFSGANVQITSKTGSNAFHGSAFFRAQRPGLNSYQRYNGANTFNYLNANGSVRTPAQRGLLRDSVRANQIGGSIGGPIWKDHLFAFFNYETQRDNSAVPGTTWFESDAFRALAPTGSVSAAYLGFPGGAPSSNGIIDETCAQAGLIEGTNCRFIAGQGLNLGSPLTTPRGTQDPTYVSPSNPGVGNGLTNTPTVALYSTVNPTAQTGAQYNGRLDSDATKKDHLSFAIYWIPLTRTNFNGTARAYNLYHHNQTNDAYTVIWNHVFSASWLNEARANEAGYRWNEILSNPQEPFGLAQSQVDGFANISGSSQLAFFGAPGPSNLNQHTYNFKDVATKVAGNHTVKFGGDVTRLYYLNNPTYSARPSYTFYNIWNFLNDAPHQESGTFDPLTGLPTANRQDSREDIYGFFVQDSWKATPTLALNFGLRYSYFGAYSAKQNNLATVEFGSGAQTYSGLTVRRGGNLTTPQKGNFGPQFGFAYSPAVLAGKGVIRGGYGLNFNQSQIAISGNVANNYPAVFGATFANSTPAANGADPRISYALAADPRSLFGYPVTPSAVTATNAANLPVAGGVTLTAFQHTQPTIYSQHYSLDTQFDLGHQYVATVGYQGSVTRHLIINSYSYITAFALGQPFNPSVDNINYFNNEGNANNNSLLVGFKHNFARNFSFDAQFSYSKSLDTGSQPFYRDPYPYRPDLAYGRSDYNYGKALKIYGLYAPTFFHGNGVLHKLGDGWNLSGIFNTHTGFPFTPSYNTGGSSFYAASGIGSLRPAAYLGGARKVRSNNAYENGKPNLNFPNSGATQPYFALPATGIPTTGTAYTLPQLPGVARNSFDGPGYLDVDATITKRFGLPTNRVLGENAAIEIRADSFNLFNNTNLDGSRIQTDILQPTFGQVDGGLAGRSVNLQARFSF